MLLNNDSFIFSDLRNKNICVIPQTLQKKLYETQSGTPRIRVTGSGDEPGGDGGKPPSKKDTFDQLLLHQGVCRHAPP